MVKSSALSCLQVDHELNPPWLFISKRTQAYFSGQLESLSALLDPKDPELEFLVLREYLAGALGSSCVEGIGGVNPSTPRVQRFEAQILVHMTDLYRAALRLTGHVSDAEDLVQETCLQAFRFLDQLREPRAAKVWVFSILRSVFLRYADRQSSERALLSLDDVDASVLSAVEVLHESYEGLLPLGPTIHQEVRATILKLPLPYREAITLAHIGGFSYKEIAQILNLPMGTVMSRLFRGRRMLRACLRENRDRSEMTP